jgi:hypothetical protein
LDGENSRDSPGGRAAPAAPPTGICVRLAVPHNSHEAFCSFFSSLPILCRLTFAEFVVNVSENAFKEFNLFTILAIVLLIVHPPIEAMLQFLFD